VKTVIDVAMRWGAKMDYRTGHLVRAAIRFSLWLGGWSGMIYSHFGRKKWCCEF
jgi:hypothetical protein